MTRTYFIQVQYKDEESVYNTYQGLGVCSIGALISRWSAFSRLPYNINPRWDQNYGQVQYHRKLKTKARVHWLLGMFHAPIDGFCFGSTSPDTAAGAVV
jgi:hypothetical protein